MINKRTLLLACGLLPAAQLAAETTELDPISVEAQAQPDATAKYTDDLQRGAANDTLGSFLDDMPNVDSASYGEAVGRPVVRGMSGYRVKILQNDQEVSDLSAMSQDHAVAVAPKTSERIKLLKGPASLLYAAQAGGVVRISDALDGLFDEPGLHGKLSNDARLGPNSLGTNAHLHYADPSWAAHVGAYRHASDAYKSGNGTTVQDSDLETQQGRVGLGWRPSTRSEWQLSGTWLTKDYGIPNDSPEETRIDMERKDFSGTYRYYADLPWLSELHVDAVTSDYLHAETEGGRKDGLFGQKRTATSVNLDWLAGNWTGRTRLDVGRSELKVCHEHGACKDFSIATRSGRTPGNSMVQQFQSTGLPYSHGHPMPDTEDRYLQLSTVLDRSLDSGHDLSMGFHSQWRQLTPNPANIQEEWVHAEQLDPDHYRRRDNHAVSVSLGVSKLADDTGIGWDLSLSQLARFPSVDELYWNGFHHATDTYIFGNADLATERSLNLDADLLLQHAAHRGQLSTFYYRFSDYIFQDQAFDDSGNPLTDPFHLSEVWFTRQTDADFYGASLRYEHLFAHHLNWPLTLFAQVDALASRRRNGDRLPRSAPGNATLGALYERSRWLASASFKRVFKAHDLAPNEESTPGYNWLSAYVQTNWPLGSQALEIWFKAENILDEQAQNHLSVLKDTAPLPGRQLSVGLNWHF